MLIFTLRRLNLFFFTVILLSILSFSLSYLFPGDALINLSGQANATTEQHQLLEQMYRTNESLPYQYLAYLSHVLDGDLGLSMTSQTPINTEVMNLMPATIELSLVAFIVAMSVGIPLGFIAAVYHRKVPDNFILSFAMLGYSVPVFWLALLAISVFSIQLGWLPPAGRLSLLYEIDPVTGIMLIDTLLSDSVYKWQAFRNATAHIILPACVVAMAPATVFIRLARSSMLEVLETRYIKAARAKGLTFRQSIFRHAVRNAMIKIIRHIGLQFANLVTIAMITEVIFNWPGIGRWLIESIYQRDYTAIQGGLLVLSSYIFLVHILTDFIYALLNPLARDKKYAQ